MYRIFKYFKYRKEARERSDSRPCAVCGLAPKIRLNTDSMGRYCLYYGVRIPPEDLNKVDEGLREYCRLDGNHFTWPVRNVDPKELLDWRIQHNDRHFNRKVLVWGVAIGVLTIVITALGVWFDANAAITVTVTPNH